jgi:hypothetical protein
MIQTLVEVKINQDQDFLKIRETLSRIGIASRKEKKLWQSCHILHKQGRFYIVHFKELFALDGKPTDFSNEDRARRNLITSLLHEWGLLTVVREDQIAEKAPLSQVKVLNFKEKPEWELCTKYTIGKVRTPEV